jgi:hypothetical protein
MTTEVAAPTPAEDPTPSQPGRFALVLILVRKLVDYGRELGARLLQRAPAIELAPYACNFGTSDTRLILARITQGLLRAQALEARLEQIAPRVNAKPRAPSSWHAPRATPATRDAGPPDFPLEHLPTAQQIAAEVRRRPIGAVIADICRDLGIMPCHPLWRELSQLIIRHGGSLARLVNDILDRVLPLAIPDDHPAVVLATPPAPLPRGSGPP